MGCTTGSRPERLPEDCTVRAGRTAVLRVECACECLSPGRGARRKASAVSECGRYPGRCSRAPGSHPIHPTPTRQQEWAKGDRVWCAQDGLEPQRQVRRQTEGSERERRTEGPLSIRVDGGSKDGNKRQGLTVFSSSEP